MEAILLSKMDWLAEWFMQLFFDPIYEYQVEHIRVSGQNTEVNYQQQDSVSIPSQTFLKKRRTSFVQVIQYLLLLGRSIKKIYRQKWILISKPWEEVMWHFNQVLEKTKSTLNHVQSALYNFKIDLSFQ